MAVDQNIFESDYEVFPTEQARVIEGLYDCLLQNVNDGIIGELKIEDVFQDIAIQEAWKRYCDVFHLSSNEEVLCSPENLRAALTMLDKELGENKSGPYMRLNDTKVLVQDIIENKEVQSKAESGGNFIPQDIRSYIETGNSTHDYTPEVIFEYIKTGIYENTNDLVIFSILNTENPALRSRVIQFMIEDIEKKDIFIDRINRESILGIGREINPLLLTSALDSKADALIVHILGYITAGNIGEVNVLVSIKLCTSRDKRQVAWMMKCITPQSLATLKETVIGKFISRNTKHISHIIDCITPDNIPSMTFHIFSVMRRQTLLKPQKNPANKVEVQRRVFERMKERIRVHINADNESQIHDSTLILLGYGGGGGGIARSFWPDNSTEGTGGTKKEGNQPSSGDGFWKFVTRKIQERP